MADTERDLRPTLCHGIVEAIATSLRSHAAQNAVELVLAHGAEDVVVRTNRKALGTLLFRLIGSAIDGAPRGRVDICVSRSAGTRSVEVRVSALAVLGDSLAALSAPRVPPLAAIRELAARLGGQISVHVRAAEGSTYVLQLPEN